ncbi:hypothetical protein Tco_0427985 [Tanacetum coccineum]
MTFPYPILFLAGLKTSWEHEMAFTNFMFAEDDEDLSFLHKESSLGFSTGSPSISINTELPLVEAKPWDEANMEQIVENVADSEGFSKPPIKRRLVQGASSSRATRQKTASSKDDSPFLTNSDDDEGLPDVLELQDTNQAVMDNAVNRRDQELLKVVEQIRGEYEELKERDKAREKECEDLKAKCEAAMADFDNNPTVKVLCEKINALLGEVKEHNASLDRMLLESKKWAGYQVSLSTLELKVASLEVEKAKLEAFELSLHQEVENVRHDRADMVSKVVPYVAMELVHSDELGRLVGRLASASVFYGRCAAFEEVAKIKDPFDLSKVKGYRSSYKKEHTKAGNDLATATFPFLSEVVADPSAPIEVLLSKNPQSLQ